MIEFIHDFSRPIGPGGLVKTIPNPFKMEDDMIDWFREQSDLIEIRHETRVGLNTWTDRSIMAHEVLSMQFMSTLTDREDLLVKQGVMTDKFVPTGGEYAYITWCIAEGFEYLAYINGYIKEDRMEIGRIIHIDNDALALQFKLTFSEALA